VIIRYSITYEIVGLLDDEPEVIEQGYVIDGVETPMPDGCVGADAVAWYAEHEPERAILLDEVDPIDGVVQLVHTEVGGSCEPETIPRDRRGTSGVRAYQTDATPDLQGRYTTRCIHVEGLTKAQADAVLRRLRSRTSYRR